MAGQSGDLEFFGMSRIIDPQGIVLAQGEEGGEHQQLVIADIDLDLDRGDLPFRLIDRRRPDLYEEILKPNADLGTATWQA
jgi:predicted amidohydrolase